MKRPVILAAGGTGGHLFPAQALAAELSRRGESVALITDARAASYDAQFAGVSIHVVPAGTPAARGVVAKLRAGMDIALGVMAARSLLRRLDPGVVVGFGGYPSLPAVLAAQRMGLPTVIHEQNAILGRVNRLVAPRSAAIAASFPATGMLREEDEPRVALTGNPVRDAIRAVRDTTYAAPSGAIEILVLGGSQGAAILSEVVPAAIVGLPESLRSRIRVSQQCRAEDIENARVIYAEQGVAADLATFVADLPQRLARCHLAITRAGASTVAELTVAGRPAILVPYPHATDDHQTANARLLMEAGAARVMRQSGLTAATLQAALEVLLADNAALAAMATAARGLGHPDAAAALADLVLAHARNGHHEPMARAA
jgi:UDP-N-acetylglucosamine--N-acetylmuramyl-(pentapeptide) pyrophosphoryl-undecaprenol N-acetylglucosamine transferase